MSSQTHKHPKPTKPLNQSSSTPSSSRSSSSSLSSHLAMVELKQRVLTALSKLADRDTYQIAVEDLEKIIQNLTPEGIPMILNCLYDASNDPKPGVKKESLRLLTVVCASHSDSTSTHLTKIIAHIVKRLKDSDSGVKDACRDAIGALSAQYLKGGGGDNNAGLGSVVALFVKPLFEAMGEQNKGVQSGAAICMAKMVECASDPPISAFQKLCPRICKLLNNPNFLAKAAILLVVSSLSQVGAIAPQSLEHLLPSSIHDCLTSTDWATRKAAADALNSLALHSSSLITDGAPSTLAVLEACRFDKIKPVRDSMTEALQLWKKIVGKGDGAPNDPKSLSSDGANPEPVVLSETSDLKKVNPGQTNTETSAKDSSTGSSSNLDSSAKAKAASISEKAVVILKKKAPALTDKELNPEFFQKLERRGSDDLPVEVVVSRKCLNSSSSNNDEESGARVKDSKERENCFRNIPNDDFHGSANNKYHIAERGNDRMSRQWDNDDTANDRYSEKRVNVKELRTKAYDNDNRIGINQREGSANLVGFSKADGQSEGSFMNNRGNWLAIQRQLLQLERQQAHLMNMLEGFMGGSHDGMVTLENRVRGLERIVEDMARDLSISSGRGSSFTGFEGYSSRPSSKYNSFADYSTAKYGRGGDGRIPFGERFAQSDGNTMGMRGRGPSWRSDMSEGWDFPGYSASRNGQMASRRAFGGGSVDGRSPKSVHESDQGGSRRAWDKVASPIRLGEGPSARSVWQASKDEATLEAIRVAGEDNGTSQATRVAIPERTAETLVDDNVGQERDTIWTSWSNAMDALQAGDIDSAYAEVLSTGDDLLLVKLMDRSGPVLDQLSSEIVCEILHGIGQFLLEQNLYDICLSWIQQLIEIVMENGPDVFGIPMEVKKEMLLNLHEVSSTIDTAENWEGVPPDQLLLLLASAWGIDLQQHDK